MCRPPLVLRRNAIRPSQKPQGQSNPRSQAPCSSSSKSCCRRRSSAKRGQVQQRHCHQTHRLRAVDSRMRHAHPALPDHCHQLRIAATCSEWFYPPPQFQHCLEPSSRLPPLRLRLRLLIQPMLTAIRDRLRTQNPSRPGAEERHRLTAPSPSPRCPQTHATLDA